MGGVVWIRLRLNFFDDERIKLIEALPDRDSILLIYIRLLILAGKTNHDGFVLLGSNIALTAETIATIFNRPVSTVRLALQTFERFEMIEVDEDGGIVICDWEETQNTTALEMIREKTRVRNQRYRERLASKKETIRQLGAGSDVSVTSRETSRDGIEEDIDKDKRIKDLFKSTTKTVDLNGSPPSKNFKKTKNADPRFNRFWTEYPRRQAKAAAMRAWAKLFPDDALLSKILAALDVQKASPQWRKDDGAFIPLPATWLNGSRWEDEIIAPGETKAQPKTPAVPFEDLPADDKATILDIRENFHKYANDDAILERYCDYLE